MNPALKDHFVKHGLQFVGQDVQGERMEIVELEGRLEFFITNACERATGPHTFVPCSSRSLLLCRSAVPSRVHLKAHQTISSILRPPVSRCRKTPELPLQRLPAVPSVSSATVLHQSNFLKQKAKHLEDAPEFTFVDMITYKDVIFLAVIFLSLFFYFRDMYYCSSSGGSSPEPDISELKFPCSL